MGVKKAQDKRLVADISVAGDPDPNKYLLNRATSALQAVHLQSLQLVRIQEALDQVVSRAARGDGQACRRGVRLRIWALGPYVCGGGWSYFMLEKADDPLAPARAAEQLVELFLYRECEP
jgi:hypothetical protein